jgi:hypothetical protein
MMEVGPSAPDAGARPKEADARPGPDGRRGMARLWDEASQWIIPSLWVILAILVASLFVLAGILLIKTGFFGAKTLKDEHVKALWAFLGVALGAAVTLIGALLAEQHNRRTAALTAEANTREALEKDREDARAKQAEERQHIDTVAKILELITVENEYAKPARIAGAIATLMELRRGSVALRILGQLWKDDRVDSDTAVWLIDQVLEATHPPVEGGAGDPVATDALETSAPSVSEVNDAIDLLRTNAGKLRPLEENRDEGWYLWPSTLRSDDWPTYLSEGSVYGVTLAIVAVLLSRRISFWVHVGAPVEIGVLQTAFDKGNDETAAIVLGRLVDSGAMETLDLQLEEEVIERVRDVNREVDWSDNLPWFTTMLDQITDWASGASIAGMGPAPPIAIPPERTSGGLPIQST